MWGAEVDPPAPGVVIIATAAGGGGGGVERSLGNSSLTRTRSSGDQTYSAPSAFFPAAVRGIAARDAQRGRKVRLGRRQCFTLAEMFLDGRPRQRESPHPAHSVSMSTTVVADRIPLETCNCPGMYRLRRVFQFR